MIGSSLGPWKPKRHRCCKARPLKDLSTLEPPLSLSGGENLYTPNDSFMYRKSFTSAKEQKVLNCLKNIKALPKPHSNGSSKCVVGLSWSAGAVAMLNGRGARLRDVLLAMGVKSNEKYISTANPYGASIPLAKAMGKECRKMNPTRMATNDYKGFSPSTDWDTVDFKKSPAIQAMPVTSAFKVSEDGFVEVRGYAWSGGGRRIVRVDLNANKKMNRDCRHYGWSLWTIRIPVDPKQKGKEVEIWAKAVDSAYNVQPENFENIWNLRGVLSNAYHRVKITVD
ncbi:mitochondrial, Probable sulfite oxidase [Lucilia cuprina]|nr:mitochondrial, Probable sulfite oxidase [Lucilia cuprina]